MQQVTGIFTSNSVKLSRRKDSAVRRVTSRIRELGGDMSEDTTTMTVPSEAFASKAHISAEKYTDMYARSVSDPVSFWAEQGKILDWMEPYTQVKKTCFEFGRVDIKWYSDGVLNVSANCIDRHLPKKSLQTAIIFEPDDPEAEAQHITYKELSDKVNRFANVLLSQGVMRGDRVVIYLPMIPEAAYAMLACARIGAIHSIVFAGFSPDALANRINDCGAKLVITSDTAPRGGKRTPLKANTDAALLHCSDKVRCLVVKHTGDQITWIQGRDVDVKYLMEHASPDCPPRPMNAEDPLFILYTSGSTGKPKGVVHSSGGYLAYAAMTHKYVFDYHDGDVFWCTADVGWVTGHSYIVYGPLANGATTVMFEGVPSYPDAGRLWAVCEKHKVNQFYTAPTALRSLMGQGNEWVEKYDLSSLKLLGTVGEPINPEAWNWYNDVVGGGHLVANRNRRPSFDAAAGRDPDQTGLCHRAVLWRATGDFGPDHGRRIARNRDRGRAVHQGQLARPNAHRLGRSRAVPGDLFPAIQRLLLLRRRLSARRRRLLLDHRPRR